MERWRWEREGTDRRETKGREESGEVRVECTEREEMNTIGKETRKMERHGETVDGWRDGGEGGKMG